MSAKAVKLRKIGETMRIYREASGRAIEVAANSLGVSVDLLMSAEKGKIELTFLQYLELSELYGVGFSAFFEHGKAYFNPPHIPQEIVDYLKQKMEDYCREKRKTRTEVRVALGMSATSFHYFFRGGSTFLSPQVAENIVALFNLTSGTLKSVCKKTTEIPAKNEIEKPPIGEQDIQEDFNHIKNAVVVDQFNKKPDERNKTMDALTMVTDALYLYKKRKEIVAELENIIKTAQALIEEMKA